jgi:hypothetical protein
MNNSINYSFEFNNKIDKGILFPLKLQVQEEVEIKLYNFLSKIHNQIKPNELNAIEFSVVIRNLVKKKFYIADETWREQ